MKKFMKLGAVVLAIVMVLSMSVTAFASSPATLSSGTVGTNSGTALDKSVKIAKSLRTFNPDTLVVNAPTITYSYSISGVTGGFSDQDNSQVGSTITDTNSVKAVTMTPPATMPKLNGATAGSAGTISWTTEDQLSASSEGVITNGTEPATVNTKYLTVDFSEVTFNAAGVYRYAITETIAASAYTAAGVTDGTANASDNSRTETLYLDVYVRDEGTNESGRQIYGYVLATANTNQPQTTSNKVSEFTADEYHTSNVTVGKTVTGDAAMNNHAFPFNVAFANSNVTANVELKKSVNNAAASDMTAAALSSTTDFVSIANGGTVKYIGIPAGTTVSAYETNDVLGTTYASSATVTETGTNATSKNISWTTTPSAYVAYNANNTQAYNSNLASVVTTNTSANFTEPFVNALVLISPTGVALRIAPYALMLGVGLFLVLFMRRRKNRAEA